MEFTVFTVLETYHVKIAVLVLLERENYNVHQTTRMAS